jgi:hypothetical protein
LLTTTGLRMRSTSCHTVLPSSTPTNVIVMVAAARSSVQALAWSSEPSSVRAVRRMSATL